ncbi:hypothetical protein HMI56_004280, partial [Coelomomyces lativittatus]
MAIEENHPPNAFLAVQEHLSSDQQPFLNGKKEDHHPLQPIATCYLDASASFLKKTLAQFDHLHVHDFLSTQRKLAWILQKGSQNVHFISDFDMTMTQQWVNGKRGTTSHGVVTQYSRFPDSFREKVTSLYQTYYPIEIDPHLPLDVKYKHMEDWWVKAHALILETGITKLDLDIMAKESPIVWRPQLDVLL